MPTTPTDEDFEAHIYTRSMLKDTVSYPADVKVLHDTLPPNHQKAIETAIKAAFKAGAKSAKKTPGIRITTTGDDYSTLRQLHGDRGFLDNALNMLMKDQSMTLADLHKKKIVIEVTDE